LTNFDLPRLLATGNDLEQFQAITDQWLVDYNEYRPMKRWVASHRYSTCPG